MSLKNNSSSNKTILHVIDTTGPGGAETVFIELADRLRECGYRSIVVIRGPGWVHDELLRRGIQPHVLPAKGSFNFSFLWALVRLVRSERVDLIQSHLLGSNIYCAMVGMLTGRPVIATFHGRVDVDPNERLRWLKLQLMNSGVSQFVTVSKRLSEEIQREGLLDARKTTVIYNGIDIGHYGKERPRQLRARLGLPDDTVLIGSLGNVRPAKAYDVLIKAAPLVVQHFSSAHFVVAGDIKRSLMEQLQPLIDQSGVASHIHFLGFSDDSAAFLSELDVFLLCSKSEGFSISTIEAMATRLPVVVTRCGGPEEIVEHELNALMVDSGDAAAIANALVALLSDRNLGERLSGNGYARAQDAFGMERMLNSYCELYAQALSKQRA